MFNTKRLKIMVQLKAVYLRMILAIIILSLNNGCSPQKDKSQSNEQVESVPKVNLKGINDTFVVHKLDYEKIMRYYNVDFGYVMVGIILNDSVVEKIRELESPIIKIEFDDGYRIAKGMNRLSSQLPMGCRYSYCLDSMNRVSLEGVKGDEIYFGLGIPLEE